MVRFGLAAAAAVVVSACASLPTPSATQPPETVTLATEVWRAPDRMLQFFGSEVHARLSGAGWTSEWIVPEGSSATDVPSGVVKLEMWSVVLGDTLTCATDQVMARESCFQPIIGTGQTCSLTMDLAPDSQVSIRFRLLPQERCELAGAPALIPQPGEDFQQREALSLPVSRYSLMTRRVREVSVRERLSSLLIERDHDLVHSPGWWGPGLAVLGIAAHNVTNQGVSGSPLRLMLSDADPLKQIALGADEGVGQRQSFNS